MIEIVRSPQRSSIIIHLRPHSASGWCGPGYRHTHGGRERQEGRTPFYIDGSIDAGARPLTMFGLIPKTPSNTKILYLILPEV